MPPEVKVCGLMRHADARVASDAGAAYLGVILATGGKRTVSLEQAAETFADLPVRRVGVFVDAPIDALIRAAEVLALDVVQLHGGETPEIAQRLGANGPWRVWKAVRVRKAEDFVDAAERFAGAADGLLLDGWHPQAAGGTGSQFPWEQVARHRANLAPGLSLITAGGLRPDNVGRAITLLRPDVVDVSSGVERAPGQKDSEAVRAFVAAATEGNFR